MRWGLEQTGHQEKKFPGSFSMMSHFQTVIWHCWSHATEKFIFRIWMDFSDFPEFQNFLISKFQIFQMFVLIWNNEFHAFQCIKGTLLAKYTCLYPYSLRNRWKVNFLIMFVYFSFLKMNYQANLILKYVIDATVVCCWCRKG